MLTIERHELQSMLVEAARIGANHAIEDMVCYHYKDACERLGVSYNTLQRRIAEGKIRPVDGRITGAELRRYLTKHVGN
ncbi:MAG: helix-turn-helix domain-containing protein [Pusillimonas sp.]